MQDEQSWNLSSQSRRNGFEMVGTLGEYQHLSALAEGASDFAHYGGSSALIVGEVPEHVLNFGFGRQVDTRMQRIRRHLQVMRGTFRFCRPMPNRSTLHKDDLLLAVAADRRGSEAEHVFRLGALQNGVE